MFTFIGTKDKVIEAIRSHEPPTTVYERGEWEKLKEFLIDSIGRIKPMKGDVYGVGTQCETGVVVNYSLENDGSTHAEVRATGLRI